MKFGKHVKANPRVFYRYINSQTKDVQGIPRFEKEARKYSCPIRFQESKRIQWPVHGCVYQN